MNRCAECGLVKDDVELHTFGDQKIPVCYSCAKDHGLK